VLLEKDGENPLDRSCEKLRNISYIPRQKERRKIRRKDISEGKTRKRM
jgi:hypothetical protein